MDGEAVVFFRTIRVRSTGFGLSSLVSLGYLVSSRLVLFVTSGYRS